VKFPWLALLTLLTLPVACRRSGDRTVYVELPTAGHLKEGAPVVFGGIDIGRVRRLTPLPSSVRLELLIQRADAPLQAGDQVAVRPVGIFGDETVVIMPSAVNGRALRDGDSLHAAAPEPPSPTREAFARAIMQDLAERWRLVDSTKAAR
jgi:ABC-type transporter Mla subunit MlaD